MLPAASAIHSSMADTPLPVSRSEASRTMTSPSTSAELGTASISRRSPSLEGRLTILVLLAQERIVGNLAGLADRLGERLGFSRGKNESNGSFVVRLLLAINGLPKEERSALGSQLAQLAKGLRLETVLSALRNPAGLDAATIAIALEASRGNDPDPAAGRVVSSYRQNSEQAPWSTRAASSYVPQRVSPSLSASQEGSGAEIDMADGTAAAKATFQREAGAVRGVAAAAPSAGNIEGTATHEELPGRAKEYGPLVFDEPRSKTPPIASARRQLSLPQPDASRTVAPRGREPGERAPVGDAGDIVRDRTMRSGDVRMRTSEPRRWPASIETDGAFAAVRNRLPPGAYPEGGEGVVPPGLSPGFPGWLDEPEGDPDIAALARLLKHVLEHEEQTAGSAETPARKAITAAAPDRKAETSTPAASLGQEAGGDEIREARAQSTLPGDAPAPPPVTAEGRMPAAALLRDSPAFPFFGYALFADDAVFSEEAAKRGRSGEQDRDDDRRGEDGSEERLGSGQTTGSEENGENDVDEEVDDEAIADPVSALSGETVLAHYLTMSMLT